MIPSTTKRVGLLFGVWLASNVGYGQTDSPQLQQPEVELAKIQAELGNIDQSLRAAKNLTTQHGLGPQDLLSDRTFEAARQYFDQRDYFSAAKYYRRYTQLKQKPDLSRFLEAYFRIGVAHESLNEKVEAFIAYTNYLTVFPTADTKNYAELIEVLERMVTNVPEPTVIRLSVSEILAAIVALDVPKNIRPKILYLAASAVASENQRQLAVTWLRQAAELTKKKDLLAKIHYINGLISLASANIKESENYFAQTLSIAPPTHPIRELTYLALARISVRKGKMTLALRYYDKVTQKSSGHSEALFEATFVAIKADKSPMARAKGQEYLAQYSSKANALRIRQLLAYLDLDSGSLTQARKGISSVNQQLTELTGFLRNSLTGQSIVPMRTVLDIDAAASFLVNHPPMMESALEQLQTANRLDNRIARLKASVRNTILTAGQGSLQHLNPEWQNAIRQMGLIGERMLKIGHRLSSMEQVLFKDQISKPDQLRLDSNQQRRASLSSPLEQSKTKNINWTKVSDILDINLKVARLNENLDRLAAQESTISFLEKDQKGTSFKSRRAEKMVRIRGELMAHLEQARLEHIANLALIHRDLGPITYFLKYFALLQEESLILQKYRGERDNATTTMTGRELHRAWRYWRHLVSQLTTEYDQSQKTIAQSLSNLVAKLDQQNNQISALSDQLQQIRAQIEGNLGSGSDELFNQYVGQINKRMSKHGKWAADIEWLEYLGKDNRKQDLIVSMQYEKQVLDEALEDIKRGVIAKWPE